VTTITQDVNDFLTSTYGNAIVTNCALQLLLKQTPAAVNLVQQTFMLTEGEKYLLLEAGLGEGIFFAGAKHAAIKIQASYAEHQIITSDPRQLIEIEEAKKEFEEQMMAEFSRIEDEAHSAGLIVIAWMYPRGQKVAGKERSKEVTAYAARLGMELNADMVKVAYTGDAESFSWVVKSAGKCKVLVQGGNKMEWNELSAEVTGGMQAGAAGIAIGRNVWQAENPIEISKKSTDFFGKF
jgi:hypothetical protein